MIYEATHVKGSARARAHKVLRGAGMLPFNLSKVDPAAGKELGLREVRRSWSRHGEPLSTQVTRFGFAAASCCRRSGLWRDWRVE